MKRKIQEKNKDKIEARFPERKQKMNSFEIKCQNVKRKLNNIYRSNTEKWIFIKINQFNFLNEEVEQFTSRWSRNLVNVRGPSYLKQKAFEYCL